jgi:16S rRNA (cytosine1402-N4)-methyltransferase
MGIILNNMEFAHKSVLLNEVIENLNVKPDGVYLDCTLGGGGHSYEIGQLLNSSGSLIGIDQDNDALNASRSKLSKIPPEVKLLHGNFRQLNSLLENISVSAVDGIIYDLGVSSYQLDNVSRGFSYHGSAALDMRMNQDDQKNAYHVVNRYSENDLRRIFYTYGEEKYSHSIARNISEARKRKDIETTDELVEIIKSSVPTRYLKIGHPARRVFQAIRIEVNDELNALKQSLEQALGLLKVGGRIAVITFHSLEDRIVKETFKKYTTDVNWNKYLPVSEEAPIKYELVNKHPIIPSETEILENPRAHSAKLRVIERIKL